MLIRGFLKSNSDSFSRMNRWINVADIQCCCCPANAVVTFAWSVASRKHTIHHSDLHHAACVFIEYAANSRATAINNLSVPSCQHFRWSGSWSKLRLIRYTMSICYKWPFAPPKYCCHTCQAGVFLMILGDLLKCQVVVDRSRIQLWTQWPLGVSFSLAPSHL